MSGNRIAITDPALRPRVPILNTLAVADYGVPESVFNLAVKLERTRGTSSVAAEERRVNAATVAQARHDAETGIAQNGGIDIAPIFSLTMSSGLTRPIVLSSESRFLGRRGIGPSAIIFLGRHRDHR